MNTAFTLRRFGRRLIAAAGIVTLSFASAGGSSTAGGWAVSTLDAIPEPVAGEPVEVGFTIRQHGRTPVEVDGVAVLVTMDDGTAKEFPAAADGSVGHYVATVEVPESGHFAWSIRQGWFGEQSLGTLQVVGPSGGGAPDFVAPGLGVLAAALAMLAVLSMISERRRSSAAVSEAAPA